MSKKIGAVGVLVLAALVAAQAPDPDTPSGKTVTAIEIKGNRVRERIIRRELAFEEGDVLTPEKIRESKKNLFRLGLFKSLEIEEEEDEATGGVKVTVNAQDGWYVLAWPMVGSRGGETYAGIMFMEHNYFRESERFMMFATYSEGDVSGMLGLWFSRYFVMAGAHSASRREYLYADGGYSAKDFDEGWDDDEAEDFGVVTNDYDREWNRSYLHFGIPLREKLNASFGLNIGEVSYGDASVAEPEDEGDINSWLLSLSYGRGGGGGGFAAGIGRMFGMGMARVKDSFRPLPKAETSRSLRVELERGEDALASDEDFLRTSVRVGQTTLFRNRNSLSLSVNGAVGNDLPESVMLATNRSNGLRGVYAREYRGDRLAVFVATFRQPFFRSRTGVLNVEYMAEYATVWTNEDEWEKKGVGLALSYVFWRFPLPLGLGGTYCLDDEDWQLTFAMGGMF